MTLNPIDDTTNPDRAPDGTQLGDPAPVTVEPKTSTPLFETDAVNPEATTTGFDTDPNPATGLRWQIVRSDPDNPFTQQLIFTEDDRDILWLDLDPLTLRDLTGALTAAQSAQLTALTGQSEPAPATVPSSGPAAVEEPATPSAVDDETTQLDSRSWWRRHKVTTVLLAFVAIMMLYAFIAGGTNI